MRLLNEFNTLKRNHGVVIHNKELKFKFVKYLYFSKSLELIRTNFKIADKILEAIMNWNKSED